MSKIKSNKRTKLTDKKKKKIIADYAINQNYAETARLNGVSNNTVKRLLQREPGVAEIVTQKKEENTRDILEYMDSIADKQKEIIDLSMEALISKLKKPDAFTSVKDIATVYGVIFDKALKSKEIKLKELDNNKTKAIEDLTPLADLLGIKRDKE